MRLYREKFLSDRTIGKLVLSDWECFTLEDTVRPEGEKIYGRTAIPKGTYKVVMYYSHKFNRLVPLLLGVPNFLYIEIHTGNTPKDTTGCILVGEKVDEEYNLRNSRKAFDRLMFFLEPLEEDIWVEIIEERKEIEYENSES